jgi:hypothetical protein
MSETRIYCDNADTFQNVAADVDVRVLTNLTPLALEVKCNDCTRIFKSLPLKRKDMTVWISRHALSKHEAAERTTLNYNDASSATLDETSTHDDVDTSNITLDETPSESALAMEGAVEAHEERVARELEDANSVLSETLSAIEAAATSVEAAKPKPKRQRARSAN